MDKETVERLLTQWYKDLGQALILGKDVGFVRIRDIYPPSPIYPAFPLAPALAKSERSGQVG